MPSKVAVLTFPSLQTNANRIHDQTEFHNQAVTIISRNQRKQRNHISSQSLSLPQYSDKISSKETIVDKSALPIFSSGSHGDVDRAFKDLKSIGFNTFEKIYVLSHGHIAGLVGPQKDGISKDVNAEELAKKFMDAGGMRDAITTRFESILRLPSGGKADYRTCLRLLSCETGLEIEDPGATYTTRSARSFLHDFANQIGKQAIKTLAQLEQRYRDAYTKSNLSLEITLEAPRGWNLVMPSGESVVYHANSAREQAADKAAKNAYSKNRTKAQIYGDNRIAPFIRSNDEKKLTLIVRIGKFPGGRVYGETVEV